MSDPIRALLLETLGDRLAPSAIDALTAEIAALIDAERLRCARLCRERSELWRNTQLARSDIAQAREEARARANEAAYLADVLELGRSA
jgi:hypothetical protein